VGSLRLLLPQMQLHLPAAPVVEVVVVAEVAVAVVVVEITYTIANLRTAMFMAMATIREPIAAPWHNPVLVCTVRKNLQLRAQKTCLAVVRETLEVLGTKIFK